MANISPGGVYAINDSSVKVSAESRDYPKDDSSIQGKSNCFPRLMTWDDIDVEGLPKDRIQKIELYCAAGDIVLASITYYFIDVDGSFKTNKEDFHLKNFSFQSSGRVTAIGYEEQRRKLLGLEELI